MDDYCYKSLQTLTNARYYAVQNLTKEKQHFANYLFKQCSGLAQEKAISQNTGTHSHNCQKTGYIPLEEYYASSVSRPCF